MSITSKERKFAATHLKETKTDLLKSVKGLSQAQLDFKASSHKRSIKECAYQIAVAEKSTWNILEEALKEPANPERRPEIKMTDDQLIKMIEDRSSDFKTTEKLEPKKSPFKTVEEALDAFKSARAEHIKYIKNTTEDLRNHIMKMSFGWVDCYQLCLFMSAHSNCYMQQIEKIKLDPKFPSR